VRPLTLHIGVHRTGTTFLQGQFFPRLHEIDFLHLKIPCDGKFLKNHAALDLPEIRAEVERDTDRPLLVSDESLLRPGYGGRSEPGLSRLSERFPGARIILGFRRQDRYVKSLYNNYLQHGRVLPLRRFFDLEGDEGVVKAEDLEWMRIVRTLRAAGHEEVFVYLQEEFRGNQAGLFADLSEFAGAPIVTPEDVDTGPAYPSSSRRRQKLWLFSNRFLSRGRSEGFLRSLKEVGVVEMLKTPFADHLPAACLDEIRERFKGDWSATVGYAQTHRTRFCLIAED
jgi:hypothetical protein